MAYLVGTSEELMFLDRINCLLVVPVNDDVVSTADGDGVREETDKISQWVEGGWVAWIKVEELVKIEDLNVVANCL